MKSKSSEQHSTREEGFESDDTALDTKPQKLINAKTKDILQELEYRMERLKKPRPKRDFTYFMKIGLHGASTNPHRLKAGRNVPQEKLVEVFGRGTPCYRYIFTP
jgi:hypothetical protein